MKLTLILAGPYTSCTATRDIWSEVCHARKIEIEIFNLGEKEGENKASQYNLKTFPALIHDHTVIAVGHPSKEDAFEIITNLVLKENNKP